MAGQASSLPQAVLLGHSFVHGTLKHLLHSAPVTPRGICRILRLTNLLSGFQMHGLRGGMVTSPDFAFPSEELKMQAPKFAILDFGSNDIVNGADPLQIAVTLFDLANELVNTYSVSRVAISSIIPRHHALRGMTPKQFGEIAHKVNHYVKVMCAGDPNISYHVHQGFWVPHYVTWSRDGVHPNTQLGRKMYLRSMRKAIFKILPGTH